jgi:hypothetical protein
MGTKVYGKIAGSVSFGTGTSLHGTTSQKPETFSYYEADFICPKLRVQHHIKIVSFGFAPPWNYNLTYLEFWTTETPLTCSGIT